MKTVKNCIPVLLLVLACTAGATAQVFLAREVVEEIYDEAGMVESLESRDYVRIQLSELPPDVAEPMEAMVDFLDENIGSTLKRYYINEAVGAYVVFGVDRDSERAFTFIVNFFSGNEHAVDRIREIFEENEMEFQYEEDGQYIYADGEDAGGVVMLLEEYGLVFYAYFES